MNKYLFGSKLLNLNNAKDEDWAVFVDKRGKDLTEKEHRSISCCQAAIKYFCSSQNITKNPYNALGIYQHSAPFFENESYPFNDFNILEHKEMWIKWLKAYMNAEQTEERVLKDGILPKTFYHILYQYYMIIENTHWISDEAKQNVQKIHDFEMPASYFYELRDMINSLLEEDIDE